MVNEAAKETINHKDIKIFDHVIDCNADNLSKGEVFIFVTERSGDKRYIVEIAFVEAVGEFFRLNRAIEYTGFLKERGKSVGR